MKKMLLSMLFLLGGATLLIGQAPNAFNYQAAVRDASGAVLNNQNISLRFSILQTSSSGTSVYSETHSATTNDYGLVNVAIGNGTVISGMLDTIDWSSDVFFIKTEMDPAGGTAYTDMSTQQLLSVPYALNSGSTKSLSDRDGDTWINTETNPDEDFVRMSVQGIPSFLLDTGRVWVGTRRYSTTFGNFTSNLGLNNAYFGVFAGNSSNDTARANTAIGYAALTRNRSSQFNTAVGWQALFNNVAGTWNVATGANAMVSNTTGNYNSAYGTVSLSSNVSGTRNTAIGAAAMAENTTGSNNTAIGSDALAIAKESFENVAVGYNSMRASDSTRANIAVGAFTLRDNVKGSDNSVLGHAALANAKYSQNNIAIGIRAMGLTDSVEANIAIGSEAMASAKSSRNVAIGSWALRNLTSTGIFNTSVGNWSSIALTSGDRNSAFGDASLNRLTTGRLNTAIGSGSLFNSTTGSRNTAVGERSGITNTTGNDNTYLGYDADNSAATFNNTIVLGLNARGTASDVAVVGNASMSSIGGYQGWSNLSDGSFKKDVKEDVAGLDFIMKLRPVTYKLDAHKLAKHLGEDNLLEEGEQLNPSIVEARDARSAEIRTGFIAQEVEKSAKDLGFEFNGVDAPDNPDQPYALRYAKFVAPLVKGMQEQQKLIEALQAEIEALKAKIK